MNPPDNPFSRGMSDMETRDLHGLEDWNISPDGEQITLHQRLTKHPKWVVAAMFDIGGDDVQLHSLMIEPAGDVAPHGGLTDEIRRSPNLSELRNLARTRLSHPLIAAHAQVAPETFRRTKARGRKGRTDLDYAKVAQRYVELLDSDGPVVPVLANELHLSYSTIRGLIWEARRRGLLTAAEPGQAGGELTYKARRLIDG